MSTLILRPTRAWTTLRRIRPRSLVALSSSSTAAVDTAAQHISRIEVLQDFVSKQGVPGSIACHDSMQPIAVPNTDKSQWSRLHPYLYPLAHSTTTGHVVGALMLSPSSSRTTTAPWPIVETSLYAPASFHMIAMNSEHLLRRILVTAEHDKHPDIATLMASFNDSLDTALPGSDRTLYTPGALDTWKYGLEQYLLLKIGPFLDCYTHVAWQHHWRTRQDAASACIAAETAHAKFTGFGEPFVYTARLLHHLPHRQDECRDAARQALRLPLFTLGMPYDAIVQEMAVLAQLVPPDTSTDDTRNAVRAWLEQVRAAEPQGDDISNEERLADTLQTLLNQHVLASNAEHCDWSQMRPTVSAHVRALGHAAVADCIDRWS
jgi:hypothetical protein